MQTVKQEFSLASTSMQTIQLRPIVWIDQNMITMLQGNNILEAGEPVSVRAKCTSNKLPTSPC